MSGAVFFDRDDTLIACRTVAANGDLGDASLVELLEGADAACEMVSEAGFRIVVVTNQGGVARGRYTEADVERVHGRVNELLGGRVDAFRYCPFHPEGVVEPFKREHFWRKPSPGMLLDAAEALDVDLSESWMVGDSPRDMMAGRAAGCRTVLLVRAGMGSKATTAADFACASLVEAAELIVSSREIYSERSTVSLRALVGAPLRESQVRETVLATARGIAERNGVKVLDVSADDSEVVATLATSRLAAVGFAAELRRLTNDWYRHRFGVASLWGDPKGESGR